MGDSVLRKFKHLTFPKSRILSTFPISKKSEKRTKERFQRKLLAGMPNSKFFYISNVHKHTLFLLINFPRHVPKSLSFIVASISKPSATFIVDYTEERKYKSLFEPI